MTDFLTSHSGEFSALLAALMWAGASLVFTRASIELGAGNLNRLRLLFAVVVLSLIVTFTSGWGWIHALTDRDFLLLAISGVIGLAIGDRFYFTALKEMGPRLSTQIFALNPISSIFLAWWMLDETLNLGSTIGIAIALTGVFIVTSERRKLNSNPTRITQITRRGVVFAISSTLCHSTAFVLAKYVMVGRIDALHGSFLRMISAASAIWIVALITGKARPAFASLDMPFKWGLALGGTLLGPTMGVWIALYAINHAQVGVASTLLAFTPLFVIPLVIKLHGEQVSKRAVFGAVVAFIGVALIFSF